MCLEGLPPWNEKRERIELWLFALLSRQTDNAWCYYLLLREQRKRVQMSLVWLTNDHVKGFGKVNFHGQCAEWETRLIKALSYFMCKR